MTSQSNQNSGKQQIQD